MDIVSYLLGKNASGGGDISEYFDTTIYNEAYSSYFKKLPDITIPDNVTDLSNMFQRWSLTKIPKVICTNNVTNMTGMYNIFRPSTASSSLDITAYYENVSEIDVSGLNTENVTKMEYMFANNSKLTSLDLSNFITTKVTGTRNMFSYCTTLRHIDMRKFDFSNISSYSNMFGAASNSGPPNNCEIIVADDTQKTWITSNFSRLTNVKTVAEYEA